MAGEVAEAARARARALASGDPAQLEALLHEDFRWVSHIGQTFDRSTYVAANAGGPTHWHSQALTDVEVVVVDRTAVLSAVVTDEVDRGSGREVFRMPVTQVWVRDTDRWRCLAGHAGPRLHDDRPEAQSGAQQIP
jgi:ketosteroid isomerase-like protein